VKSVPWDAHNGFRNLPAVAAAMLAMLPSTTTQPVAVQLPTSIQFQDCVYRAWPPLLASTINMHLLPVVRSIGTCRCVLLRLCGSRAMASGALRTYLGGCVRRTWEAVLVLLADVRAPPFPR
jgi:hypothetical protein